MLQIRPMSEGDIDIVLEMERCAYPFPWTAGNFRDCIRCGHYCCVYLKEDQYIGYCVMSVIAGEAQILNICIDPVMQGQGLGRRLLRHLIAVAGKKSADTIFLEVRASNQAAYGLYDSFGFNEIGLRQGYYPAKGGREDALVLGLSLELGKL